MLSFVYNIRSFGESQMPEQNEKLRRFQQMRERFWQR